MGMPWEGASTMETPCKEEVMLAAAQLQQAVGQDAPRSKKASNSAAAWRSAPASHWSWRDAASGLRGHRATAAGTTTPMVRRFGLYPARPQRKDDWQIIRDA